MLYLADISAARSKENSTQIRRAAAIKVDAEALLCSFYKHVVICRRDTVVYNKM